MNKQNIIKSSLEFTCIINSGKYKRNSFFSIYILNNKKMMSRFGISITTKFGNAVKRNKIKRQMKNLLYINQKLFQNNLDYIIIVKREANKLNYNEIEKNLLDLLTQGDWRKKYEKK